jgi:hypothetical protein
MNLSNVGRNTYRLQLLRTSVVKKARLHLLRIVSPKSAKQVLNSFKD